MAEQTDLSVSTVSNKAKSLSRSDLERLSELLRQGSERRDASEEIAKKNDSLVESALSAIYRHFSSEISVEKNVRLRKNIEFFLHLITYCIVMDSTAQFGNDKLFLESFGEKQRASDLKATHMKSALREISDSQILSQDTKEILDYYIEFAILFIERVLQDGMSVKSAYSSLESKWPEDLTNLYGSIRDEVLE